MFNLLGWGGGKMSQFWIFECILTYFEEGWIVRKGSKEASGEDVGSQVKIIISLMEEAKKARVSEDYEKVRALCVVCNPSSGISFALDVSIFVC